MGAYPKDMMVTLEGLKLKHEGRHHSGIGNVLNSQNHKFQF